MLAIPVLTLAIRASHNRPIGARTLRRRNDAAARHFFGDLFEQPFRTVGALEFFEARAFVAQAALKVRGPFGDADVWVGLVDSGEGEGGWVFEVKGGRGGAERGLEVGWVERRGGLGDEDAGGAYGGED